MCGTKKECWYVQCDLFHCCAPRGDLPLRVARQAVLHPANEVTQNTRTQHNIKMLVHCHFHHHGNAWLTGCIGAERHWNKYWFTDLNTSGAIHQYSCRTSGLAVHSGWGWQRGMWMGFSETSLVPWISWLFMECKPQRKLRGQTLPNPSKSLCCDKV